MKDFFSSDGLKSWLANRQIRWWSLSSGCLLVAGYIVCWHYGFLIFLSLAIASIITAFALITYLHPTRSREHPPVLWTDNVPEINPGWDYRPSKTIRARGVLYNSSTKTSDVLNSNPFGISDNVWSNDNSRGDVAPTFVDNPSEAEEPSTQALPQTADPVDAAPVDDVGV